MAVIEIVYEEWRSALDERMCWDCGALAGRVFRADLGPHPPLHPNCRCARVYFSSAYVTVPDPPEGMPPAPWPLPIDPYCPPGDACPPGYEPGDDYPDPSDDDPHPPPDASPHHHHHPEGTP